jgi:type II secretory pathway component PulM
MRDFWAKLTSRERLFVRAGGAIAGAFAILLLVISPAMNWRSSMAQRRDSAEDLHRLVAEASALAGVGAAAPGVNLEAPIQNVLTESSGQHAIIVNYRNVRPDGGVEANVVAGPRELFDWLRALEVQYGVSVATADIARIESGDKVTAQLTLVRRKAS